MANLIFIQPYNMGVQSLDYSLGFTVTQQTSNRVVVDFGDGRDIYTGSNLTYSGNLNTGGIVTGGTIQSLLYTRNATGNVVFANGFGNTVAAVQVANFLAQDNAQGLFSYAFRGNDRFVGSPGNDVMRGYAGNDLLLGKNGNDGIFGLNGDDRALGGFGNDTLVGGLGNDRFFGEAGNDVLLGQAGDDILGGGLGNDVLRGQTGGDVLFGDGGNDRLFGDAGLDRLFGGTGSDTISGGAGNDVVRGGAGNDILNGTDTPSAGTGERDILFSSDLNDSDTFVLGDGGSVFYDDQGNNDFALIRDFDLFGFTADRIQLEGFSSFYSLSNVFVGGVSGTGIFEVTGFSSDLIGIVQGVNSSQLSLTNSSQFVYV